MGSYNIFISWSGDRSRGAAQALHRWIPRVIQSAKPSMSTTDIDKGARGLESLTEMLVGVNVGICCITAENRESSWIHFEAGALSKTLSEKTRLCTYLLDGLRPSDVIGPLSMFQASQADKLDTLQLLQSVNRAIDAVPLNQDVLEDTFEVMWPKLEQYLKAVPDAPAARGPKRSVEDMVVEILTLMRATRNEAPVITKSIENLTDLPYRDAQRQFDVMYFKQQLIRTGGNKTRAELSGVDRTTLYEMTRRYPEILSIDEGKSTAAGDP